MVSPATRVRTRCHTIQGQENLVKSNLMTHVPKNWMQFCQRSFHLSSPRIPTKESRLNVLYKSLHSSRSCHRSTTSLTRQVIACKFTSMIGPTIGPTLPVRKGCQITLTLLFLDRSFIYFTTTRTCIGIPIRDGSTKTPK
jgi:hypothetical protein